MWFRVKGVPAIVTVGADARWNEIGELAAVRGAQLLFNLAYGDDANGAAHRRTQLWAQLASFQTLSVTVNAANPAALARPSAPACGGSAVWCDFGGHRKEPATDPSTGSGQAVEVFSQYSACRVASIGPQEGLVVVSRRVPATNAYYPRYLKGRNPHLEPWYEYGAASLG
jgi:hypothetical protein